MLPPILAGSFTPDVRRRVDRSYVSLAALSRQDVPEGDRRIHVIYADEVQDFINGTKLASVRSRARKYRSWCTVCAQTTGQLPKDAVDAVFGNYATVMSFRVGGEDAETLKREFPTILPAFHLQDPPDHKACVRAMSEGSGAGPSRPIPLRPGRFPCGAWIISRSQ
jgi:hypothetical protein